MYDRCRRWPWSLWSRYGWVIFAAVLRGMTTSSFNLTIIHCSWPLVLYSTATVRTPFRHLAIMQTQNCFLFSMMTASSSVSCHTECQGLMCPSFNSLYQHLIIFNTDYWSQTSSATKLSLRQNMTLHRILFYFLIILFNKQTAVANKVRNASTCLPSPPVNQRLTVRHGQPVA